MIQLSRLEALPITPVCEALAEAAETLWPRFGRVAVGYELMPLDELSSNVPTLVSERVARRRHVLDAYTANGRAPFEPVRSNRLTLLGTIAEINTGGNVILDGLHGAVTARDSGLRELLVARLEPQNDSQPFPGTVILLNQVEVSDDPSLVGQRLFSDKDVPLFRPGEAMVDLAIRLLDAKLRVS